MSSRNPAKEERERLLRVAGDAGRPMDERIRALEDLIDRGAVDEVSKIATESKWPDDMREEAVYGLVELDATEKLSRIVASDRCPGWLRGVARELMP